MQSKFKRLIHGIIILGVFGLARSDNRFGQFEQGLVTLKPGIEKLDLRTRMDLAMEQEVARTMDPELGYVPRHRMLEAYEYAEAQRAIRFSNRLAAAIPGVEWKERGPNNVGGRTRAIMIDPNDGTGKTVFSAGVAGGLWKTTDITAEQPTWVSVNDFFDNMAITTLAYNPSDQQTMYFGTGEGFFNADAVQGDGIWKSTDGGDTWSQLSATNNNVDFGYVNKIVVTSSGTVLAACRGSDFNNITAGGIQRSTNGGTSWTQAGTGTSGKARRWAADLEIAADGDIYGTFGILYNDGIFKSTDDGASWTLVYTSDSDEFRIEIATAPSNSEYVYALVHDNGNDGLKKTMRTTNGGTSWTSGGTPSWFDQNCSTPSDDFTRGQAWYDLIAAVDPNDENVAWIGGVDIFRTTNGGTNWTQMTNWAGNCDYPEVHADQHAMVYGGSSEVIYFGNDGGIYRVADATDTNPTFKRKEYNYNTTQFYSVAVNPTANSSQFISGAQDNGSNKFSELGVGPVVEVTGGDGGFAHIDALDPDYQFTSFTGLTFSRSSDGGLSFDFVASNSNGSFINPSDYDPIGQDMYAGYSGGRYGRWLDAHTAGDAITSRVVPAFSGGEVTAVTTSSSTGGKVWFGLDNDRVVLVTNAAGNPSGSDLTSGGLIGGASASISCIAHEVGNEDHLLVTLSNYGVTSVWETTNGGTSWTAVEGNLPDIPVRWALFNPGNSDQALIATELGVWSTDDLDGASTVWEASNSGLANTRVDMLQLRSSDNLVVAATHGRGVFTSDIFCAVDADFVANKKVAYAESTIDFADASYNATSWFWEFGDGGFSTDENPSHSYMVTGKYEVTLTINSGADTETKTDYIHILPNLGTPYTTSDGGDFESNPDHFGGDAIIGGINLWELGAPATPLNTVNSGTKAWKTDLNTDIIEADYQCALHTPNFNFSNAGTYTINFRKSMESIFSNAPMGAQVQYSLNNGLTWTRLGSDADANWYDKGPTSGTNNMETSVIHDRIGFNSNYSNDATSYDVSFLAGNSTVAFRFVLFVDAGWSGGYNTDGFMIDDFAISGPTNAPNVNITDEEAGFAMQFNGTTGYLQGTSLDIPQTFSIEMWIDPDDTDDQVFVSKTDGGTNEFSVGYNSSGLEVTIGTESFSSSTKTPDPQHLAITVAESGGNSQVTVYRDGNQLWQQTVTDVYTSNATDGLIFGQDGSSSNFYSGSLDEVRIWNYVRTIDEIRKEMHLTLSGLETGLLGYWQFNEGTASLTRNQITSNQLALISGVTWISSLAPVGPGVAQKVTVSTDGSVSFASVNMSMDFTGVSGSFDVIAVKINANPQGTQPEDNYILSNSVKNPYWIINNFGTGSFSSVNLTYDYGPGVLLEPSIDNVNLFKRATTSSGNWNFITTAASLNTTSGIVTYNNLTSFSQSSTGETNSPLPVELVSFNVRWDRKMGNNYLEWLTASEFNNSHFEIERSIDAVDWEKIGKVEGRRTTTALNNYHFIDRAVPPMNTVYYRLKQVDFSGEYTYSDIRSVAILGADPYLLQLYPNPVNQLSKLIFFTPYNEQIIVRIIDSQGRDVSYKQFVSSVGKNEIPIQHDLGNSTGIYYMIFKTQVYSKVIPFVKN